MFGIDLLIINILVLILGVEKIPCIDPEVTKRFYELTDEYYSDISTAKRLKKIYDELAIMYSTLNDLRKQDNAKYNLSRNR